MAEQVKLQALECMASPSFLIQVGDIFERHASEAADLVKAGIAIVVSANPESEEVQEKPAKKRGAK